MKTTLEDEFYAKVEVWTAPLRFKMIDYFVKTILEGLYSRDVKTDFSVNIGPKLALFEAVKTIWRKIQGKKKFNIVRSA